jgi:16S rRNA (cytidine1402-2'-O)-methyltransferase
MNMESAALYVVATPIGHLADLTLRAIEVLKSAVWIACEDTRHTRPLLAHHGIDGRLLAVHEHNEAEAAGKLIERLAAGESVALVSDAGTPAISDPGARLVARVRAAGFRVVPVPGASALTCAMSAAGLDGPFAFVGFLPAKSAARRRELERFATCPLALVFYEAPHRVLETLDDFAAVFGGERRLVIAKELTKLFETFHACTVAEARGWFAEDANRLRGEFVLIVDAPPAGGDAADAEASRVLALLLAEGLPVKQAAGLTEKIAGGNKKAHYERALQMRQAE